MKLENLDGNLWKLVFLSACVGYVRSSSVRLLTYNAGLASALPQYDVRKTQVGSSISNTSANIVCLQEVWFAAEVSSIVSSVKDTKLPYSFSALHGADGELQAPDAGTGPCPANQNTTTFLTCMATNCTDLTNAGSASICARDTCNMFELLGQQCILCLTVTNNTQPQRCLASGTMANVPGLLLLSDRPLKNPKLTWFIPDKKQFLPRASIAAEVDGIGAVVCTHFSADLGSVYFEDLEYANWEEQNMAETDALLESVSPVSSAVMMGDFNCGPGLPASNVLSTFQASYDKLTSTNFVSAVEHGSTECTYCASNPLTSSANSSLNWILDHVLVRGHTFVSAKRVYDGVLAGESFPLSDHYGVEVVIQTADDSNTASSPRVMAFLLPWTVLVAVVMAVRGV